MAEFQIIEKYFKPLTKSHKAAQELRDDVAIIPQKKDETLVVSKDVFVENVHFLLTDGGFKIASKLLRTNLSDLAAAGAKPLYYLLGFSVTKNTDQKFLEEFADGLKSVQDEFDVCLIGGDTVSSEKNFFSITIFGGIKNGQALSRNCAKPGDLIFVSGSIGDASIGLAYSRNMLPLSNKLKKYFLGRHFFPTPRIELGKKLLEKKLSQCAIDISDGLLADLRHICLASGLDAEIFLDKIPFSAAAKRNKFDPMELISAGDDYELIFAANPKNVKKISALSKLLKLDLTCIGNFKKSPENKFEITLRSSSSPTSGEKIKIKKFGYEHF